MAGCKRCNMTCSQWPGCRPLDLDKNLQAFVVHGHLQCPAATDVPQCIFVCCCWLWHVPSSQSVPILIKSGKDIKYKIMALKMAAWRMANTVAQFQSRAHMISFHDECSNVWSLLKGLSLVGLITALEFRQFVESRHPDLDYHRCKNSLKKLIRKLKRGEVQLNSFNNYFFFFIEVNYWWWF